MSNPTQGDLFINPLLTNISVAYMQSPEDYIAEKLFPNVDVDLPGGTFYKYNKSDWYRNEAKLRAPGTESAGGGWGTSTDTYYCNIYSFHKDVADPDRASAVSIFNLDRDATLYTASMIRTLKEKMVMDKFFTTSVWGQTDQTGVAAAPGANQFLRWDDASSDPVSVVLARADIMKKTTGKRPNKIFVGPLVYRALQNNPSVIDRVKWTRPTLNGLSKADLATAFEVEEFVVGEAMYNTAAEGVAEALTNYDFLMGKNALLAYVAPSPSLMTPSAGYTFNWRGYTGANNAFATRTKKFRMEQLESDRIETSAAFDLKVVSSDVGQFFATAVS